MSINNVVISAAGLGSRLGLDLPKCMLEIKGKPLIYYLLGLVKDIKDIRIVVGFKEQMVIDYVRSIRKDVIFVRNPSYATTTNAYSLHLGSYHMNGSFLSLDGDLLIAPSSFNKFASNCKEETLLGIVKSSTEDAVFVVKNSKGEVSHFQRNPPTDFEWSGLAYFSNMKIDKNAHFVFNEVEKKLPIKCMEIECYEIDTPQDLDNLYNNIDSSLYFE